ncbi:hypothetical protein ACOMHN_044924 [Nucella lapillus]
MCTLLPHAGNVLSASSPYITAIDGVMPLILCSVLGLGLGYMYFKIQANPFAFVNVTSSSVDLDIARRLLPIGFTNVLCCVVLSLRHVFYRWGLRVSDSVHMRVSDSVHMRVLLLVAPLFSLLNPYLYVHRLLAEQERSLHRQRLLQRLRAKKNVR